MWSLTLLALAPASALRAPAVISSRRAAIGGATAAIFAAPLQAYAAVKPCPADANNCWSTASTGKTALAPWKWPQEVDRTKAIGQLRAALEAYPQAGQAGVDLGGWTIVDDSLDSSGYQRVEFKSGLGNFGACSSLHRTVDRAHPLFMSVVRHREACARNLDLQPSSSTEVSRLSTTLSSASTPPACLCARRRVSATQTLVSTASASTSSRRSLPRAAGAPKVLQCSFNRTITLLSWARISPLSPPTPAGQDVPVRSYALSLSISLCALPIRLAYLSVLSLHPGCCSPSQLSRSGLIFESDGGRDRTLDGHGESAARTRGSPGRLAYTVERSMCGRNKVLT